MYSLSLSPEPPDFNDALILRQGCTVEHVVSNLSFTINICLRSKQSVL